MSLKDLLAKLIVKPGGRGTCQTVEQDWSVCIREAPRDSEAFFELALRHNARERAVALTKDDVFSKTKTSQWKRDKTWRLTPEAVDKFAGQISAAIEGVKKKGS